MKNFFRRKHKEEFDEYNTGETKMDEAKVVMIIAQEDFRDEEYFETKKVIEDAGVKVVTASVEKGSCNGKLGAKAEAELGLRDVMVYDYKAVVIVGGPGALGLGRYPEFNHIIKTADSAGLVVAAICIAPVLLANAGLLIGKKATVYATDESLEALRAGEAKYDNAEVIVDDNIITGRDYHAPKQFGEEIVKLVNS